MARAKYQVLVITYVIKDKAIKYAVFHRSDMEVWQFIAGGVLFSIPYYLLAVC